MIYFNGQRYALTRSQVQLLARLDVLLGPEIMVRLRRAILDYIERQVSDYKLRSRSEVYMNSSFAGSELLELPVFKDEFVRACKLLKVGVRQTFGVLFKAVVDELAEQWERRLPGEIRRHSRGRARWVLGTPYIRPL